MVNLEVRKLVRILGFSLICCFCFGQIFSQNKALQSLPETPAGKQMGEFLKNYNSQVEKDPRWQHWFSIYGPVEFYSIESSSDYDIKIWVRGTMTKGWIQFRVVLEDAPPHKLDGIGITTGYRPKVSVSSAKSVASPQLVKNVGIYLVQLNKADYFSGAVLIAKDGVPIFRKAYGMASKRYNFLNQPDTKFNLGSVTKMFTAVAIAQLVEQGKLSFTDTIAKHLPDYPNEIAKKATIHQLLTHTSGIGRGKWHNEAFQDRFIRTISEQLAMTVSPPDFEPGTDVRYSNEAWIVLAAIIEKASGQNYYDYVQKNIYDRAGMKDSGAFEGDREISNLAMSYTHFRWKGERDFEFEAGARRNTNFMSAIRGNADGRTFSTVDDLNRFAVALKNNKLLNAESVKLLMTRHIELPAPSWSGIKESYGYGLEIKTVGDLTYTGKAGSSDGVSTRFDMYSNGYTVIVLSNYDSVSDLVVGDYIRDLFVGD